MYPLANYDILTGIITSDYQVRTRWGFMGFENAFWDKTKVNDLLFPNVVVDINHRRIPYGALVAVDFHTCGDLKRKQADWPEARPMDCVVATFVIPHRTVLRRFIDESMNKYKRIGISIEHHGRKPKRMIGPYVTICDTPRNRDCWMILGDIDGQFFDNLYPKGKRLSGEVLALAHNQYDSVVEALRK